jgi:hypothetical protein
MKTKSSVKFNNFIDEFPNYNTSYHEKSHSFHKNSHFILISSVNYIIEKTIYHLIHPFFSLYYI